MRGIADGAGLSYQDVLLLNTLPDLLALSCALSSAESYHLPLSSDAVVQPVVRCPQNGGAASCSSFAVWDSATVDGGLLVGHKQNSAEANLLDRYLMVVARRPARGNAFVSAGPMGMVGVWAGMNEEQVAVALSSSPSVDVASSGQPPQFLLRQVLERAGDLTQAKRVLLAADRLYGGNVLLGDGKAPGAVAIEMSAHRHAVFETDVGSEPLVRTNHFLDPVLAMAQRHALSGPARSASLARLGALQTLLELNKGWIGADKALALLRADRDGRVSHGFGTQSLVNQSDSLQSVLFYPARLALWVAQRDVQPLSVAGSARTAEGSYLHLTLTSLLSQCLVGG
jgi:isopenicillin-N N-acyltransferase-like protein